VHAEENVISVENITVATKNHIHLFFYFRVCLAQTPYHRGLSNIKRMQKCLVRI